MKSKWESEKENLKQLILVEKLSYEDMVVLGVILKKQHYDQVQNQNKDVL